MNNNPRTIILANGLFPTSEIPLSYLDSAERIICCDGAVNKLVKYGLEPDAIVGDLDSISEELRLKYSDRLFEDKIDQETNDLTKAVKYCISENIDDIVILGATGLREDHTLGNISLLLEYSEFVSVRLVTDHGIFITVESPAELSTWTGQGISIFTNDPKISIDSTGLRYPLSKLNLSNWWMGTLNEATGSSIKLKFTKGRVIVYLDQVK